MLRLCHAYAEAMERAATYAETADAPTAQRLARLALRVQPIGDALLDATAALVTPPWARQLLDAQPKGIEPDRLYSVLETAAELGCSRSKVHQLIADGQLVATYPAGKAQVLGADLMAFIRSSRRA